MLPMNAWPSGPDGRPLSRDTDGSPAWPSDQYRRDYERAIAERSAQNDRHQSNMPTWVALLLALAFVVVIAATQLK